MEVAIEGAVSLRALVRFDPLLARAGCSYRWRRRSRDMGSLIDVTKLDHSTLIELLVHERNICTRNESNTVKEARARKGGHITNLVCPRHVNENERSRLLRISRYALARTRGPSHHLGGVEVRALARSWWRPLSALAGAGCYSPVAGSLGEGRQRSTGRRLV